MNLDREIEWTGLYYGSLVGHRITEVIAEIDEIDGSVWPVLRTVNDAGVEYEIAVSQDPEGNGPGFLHGLPSVHMADLVRTLESELESGRIE